MGFSLGSVAGAIGSAVGVGSAYMGYTGAKESEKAAKASAEKQIELAAKEYTLTSAEYGRAYMYNMGSIYSDGANTMYDMTSQYTSQKGSMLAKAPTSDVVAVSGGAEDMAAYMDSMYDMGMESAMFQVTEGLAEENRDYIYNMEQLDLNRQKMEEGISYNLDVVGASARNDRYSSIAGGIGAVGESVGRWYDWKDVNFSDLF